MLNRDDFFRETTLRICGSLRISAALVDVFDYFKLHFPLIGMSLNIRDDDLGAIRRIALAANDQKEFPEDIVPIPRELWPQIKAMPIHSPQVITADFKGPFAHLATLLKIEDRSDLILPLWIDTELQGVLTLRAAQKDSFTEYHIQLLASVSRPITIALANALAHERLKRASELLAEDNRFLRQEFYQTKTDEIVGSDAGLSTLMQMVQQVAPLNNTVLLLGETGTGKELIANAIHFSSPYKEGPFIKVNCGSLPNDFLDSELFGHEKGAFTGAIAEKRGRFERAHRGSIFLDEIGELPPQAQIRLLRVLQNREIERVGGQAPIPIDIRVIAATNRHLESMVQENTFREDLWFRINVFPLIIPPLRQRRGDIPALAVHFIQKKSKEMGIKNVPTLAPGALDRLTRYNWPGNVRELENIIEREMIIQKGGALIFDSLAEHAIKTGSFSLPNGTVATETLPLDNVIVAHIMQALKFSQGKISGAGGAAELLRINSNTLRAKMRKYGISFKRNLK